MWHLCCYSFTTKILGHHSHGKKHNGKMPCSIFIECVRACVRCMSVFFFLLFSIYAFVCSIIYKFSYTYTHCLFHLLSLSRPLSKLCTSDTHFKDSKYQNETQRNATKQNKVKKTSAGPKDVLYFYLCTVAGYHFNAAINATGDSWEK